MPDDRAKLYKEVIDLLLLRWDEARQGWRLQDLLREAKRNGFADAQIAHLTGSADYEPYYILSIFPTDVQPTGAQVNEVVRTGRGGRR